MLIDIMMECVPFDSMVDMLVSFVHMYKFPIVGPNLIVEFFDEQVHKWWLMKYDGNKHRRTLRLVQHGGLGKSCQRDYDQF